MEQKKHTAPWYHQPIWLGLLGLALMLGGYKLSTFLPEQKGRVAKTIEELDRMRQGDHEDFGERLRQLRPEPPFRWPGRMMFLAGVGLFVTAGVIMTRRPVPAPEQAAEEEPAR